MVHRHGISDEIWNKINVNLPGSVRHTGRNCGDNRRFTLLSGFRGRECRGGGGS